MMAVWAIVDGGGAEVQYDMFDFIDAKFALEPAFGHRKIVKLASHSIEAAIDEDGTTWVLAVVDNGEVFLSKKFPPPPKTGIASKDKATVKSHGHGIVTLAAYRKVLKTLSKEAANDNIKI